MVSQLWADVKYHVPTGLVFRRRREVFYPFGDATALTTGASTGIAKRLFFYVFVSVPQYPPQFNSSEVGKFTSANVGGDGAIGDLAHSRRLLITFSVIYKI